MAEAVRTIGMTRFTYYRWRKEHGGLKTNEAKRLKELEQENERLRKAVSDLALEKLIPKEAAPGTEGECQRKFRAPPVVAIVSITSLRSSACRSASPAVCSVSIVRPDGRSRAGAQTRRR